MAIPINVSASIHVFVYRHCRWIQFNFIWLPEMTTILPHKIAHTLVSSILHYYIGTLVSLCYAYRSICTDQITFHHLASLFDMKCCWKKNTNCRLSGKRIPSKSLNDAIFTWDCAMRWIEWASGRATEESPSLPCVHVRQERNYHVVSVLNERICYINDPLFSFAYMHGIRTRGGLTTTIGITAFALTDIESIWARVVCLPFEPKMKTDEIKWKVLSSHKRVGIPWLL